ncbi:MAG: hypothetical protein FWD44_05775 [Oscillospiraceae bacterium]|nr:hypothetical protein [Oscillospiraceae bacterium]
MKKILVCALLVVALISVNAQPAQACWMAPLEFELFSKDGSRVFVFEPRSDDPNTATAGVYDYIDGKLQLIYEVKGLASFTYASCFFFTDDMMHFINVFPQEGADAFEAFSSGIRTRVVERSEFIDNHASIEGESSIGPNYTVNWKIEGYSSAEHAFVISTTEDKTLLFDPVTAEFVPIGYVPASLSNAKPAPVQYTGTQLVDVSQPSFPLVPVLLIGGSLAVLVGIGLVVYFKRRG